MTPRRIPEAVEKGGPSLYFIEDMILCMERIRDCISGLKGGSFDGDHQAADSVIRSLEIIGEAVKNVSAGTRAEHPEFPWRRMAGWKGRITREKSGAAPDALADFVRDELPALQKTLIKIYVTEKSRKS